MAIYYELPSGKGVYITVEQLLSMTDADIQDLVASNTGYSTNNPFLKLQSPDSHDENDYYDEDDFSPDMLSDGDDVDYGIDINNIPDD